MSDNRKFHRSKSHRKPSSRFDQISPLNTSEHISMAELLNENRKIISIKSNKKFTPAKRTKKINLPLDLDNVPSMDEIFCENEAKRPTLTNNPSLKKSDFTSDQMKRTKTAGGLPKFENLGNMEQYMVRHEGAPSKNEMVKGTVVQKRKEGVFLDIGYGSQGFISRNNTEIWNSVEIGDKVLVSFNSAKVKNNFPCLTPHKIIKRNNKGFTKTNPKVDTKFLAGNCFVIDGSNINRSYLSLKGSASLIPLLTLITTLLSYKARFYCIFDANERFVLQENKYEPQGMRIYDLLINELRTVFFQVPGGSNADDYILETAHQYELPIISNDRFNKLEDHHQETYSWLNTNSSRVIKGKVENGILKIEGLGINAPLGNNLIFLTEQLKKLLGE